MQITAMPAPTLFKSKWNTFITKLSPKNDQSPQHRRRRSSSDENNNQINNQKRRKHSDAVSVGTYESNVSIADKFRQAIPFFRRSSSNISSSEENLVSVTIINTPIVKSPTTTSNTTTTSTTYTPPTITTNTTCSMACIYYKNLEKLQSLYTLAVDEINYAEDSQGSSYYSGDLVTAREALDDCANAFMQLLTQTNDHLTREGLQSSMAPKLLGLQKRMDALPAIDENSTGVYY